MEDTQIISGQGRIAKALAAAQGEMKNPSLDSVNPFFKTKYASLAAIRNACIPILSKHGIAVIQYISSIEKQVSCTTTLIHESGESITGPAIILPVMKSDAQGIGSAATYARRYSLQSVVGIVGDADDDGHAAVKHEPKADSPKTPQPEPEQPKQEAGNPPSDLKPSDGAGATKEQAESDNNQPVRTLTPAQVKYIGSQIKRLFIDSGLGGTGEILSALICEKYGTDTMEQIPMQKANEILVFLKEEAGRWKETVTAAQKKIDNPSIDDEKIPF